MRILLSAGAQVNLQDKVIHICGSMHRHWERAAYVQVLIDIIYSLYVLGFFNIVLSYICYLCMCLQNFVIVFWINDQFGDEY